MDDNKILVSLVRTGQDETITNSMLLLLCSARHRDRFMATRVLIARGLRDTAQRQHRYPLCNHAQSRVRDVRPSAWLGSSTRRAARPADHQGEKKSTFSIVWKRPVCPRVSRQKACRKVEMGNADSQRERERGRKSKVGDKVGRDAGLRLFQNITCFTLHRSVGGLFPPPLSFTSHRS